MRKILMIISVLLSFTFSATAQMIDPKFGAKAGVNFSEVNDSELKGKTGFHIGLLAEIYLGEQFSVQPEILYSAQGAKAEEEGYTSKLNLDYISVPLMAKYYIADGLNIQAGPQFSFLTKAEIKGEIDDLGSATLDIKDELESFELGLNFGLGYELPMGVFFDARYNIGLTKINKESIVGENDLKNRVFQIGVGYKF